MPCIRTGYVFCMNVILEGQRVRSPADLSKTLRKGIERQRMFYGHLLWTSLFEFVLFRFILPFS